MFYRINELALGLAALAVFLGVIEVGFRLGRRYERRSDDAARAHVSALQAAMLGLLALLLGFTFAMAISRFDTRRSLVLDEANAIGTTYLRAQLLPAESAREIDELLRSYVAARLRAYDAGIEGPRLEEAEAAASGIQDRLWAITVALAREDAHSVVLGWFVQSLNEVIDLQERHRTSLENHVPEIVFHLLFAVSVAALGFVAYGSGLTGQRRFVSTGIVAVLIVLVLVTILDVDRPRRGLIEVGYESMLRLEAATHGSGP